MRFSAGLILCLVSLSPAFAQVERVADKEAPKTLDLGGKLADHFTALPDMDGSVVKAADMAGKTVVINFYSIQCPIQRDWDQRLAQIQREHEKGGVIFLHINSNHTEIGKSPAEVDEDKPPYQHIREYLKKHDLPFRILLDHGNKVADRWTARTTPHIYVFDKDGRLVYRGLVDDDQKNRNAAGRNNFLIDVLGKLNRGEDVEPFSNKEVGCTIKRIPAEGAGGTGSGRGQGRRGGRN